MSKPRATWTGSLQLNMLSVPVGMYVTRRSKPATANSSTPLRRVERATLEPAKQQYVSSVTGDVVTDFVKVMDTDDGPVIVEEEEVKSLAPKKSETIQLKGFVDAIPKSLMGDVHQLEPRGEGLRGYRLMVLAMAELDLYGIGTYASRGTNKLCAVFSENDTLYVSSLAFHDEVADVIDNQRTLEVSEAEIQGAKAVMQALHVQFDHDQFVNEHREQVEELLEAKASGKPIPEGNTDPEQLAKDEMMAKLIASLPESGEQ